MSALIAGVSLSFSAIAHSTYLANQVRGEAIALGDKMVVSPRIVVTDDDVIESDPNGVVKIGLSRIMKDTASLTPELQTELVAFYLAHELWHQKQYQIYGVGSVLGSEKRSLYECQADIMGGLFASATTEDVLVDYVANYPGDQLLDLISKMGESFHVGATHPSPVQRRMAVAAGIEQTVFKMAQIERRETDSEETGETIGQLHAIAVDIAARMDSTISDAAWSLKLCRAIVNFDPAVVKNIKIRGEKIKFDEDPQVATVSYSIVYRNLSDQPVCMFFGVRSAVVSRELKSADPMPRSTAIAFYDLRLNPGEEKTVTGTLGWSGEAHLEPTLLFEPDQPGHLMSAQYCAG